MMNYDNSFQHSLVIFRQIDMIAFECALLCLLSAQLFKVQVNLSWRLAVWSQEVASVKCGLGCSGGIRHQGGKSK